MGIIIAFVILGVIIVGIVSGGVAIYNRLVMPKYYPFVSREEKMGVNIKYSAI